MGEVPNIKSVWDFRDPAGSERKFRELLEQYPSNTEFHVEVLTQIARTHSLRRQFSEADVILDDVEGLLRAEMHRARVRWFLERGRVRNSAGDRAAALPLFEMAYKIAMEHQLAFLAVDAAHMIAIAHPDSPGQLEWGLRTIALVESSGDESIQSWLGPLYNNAGWTFHDRGDLKKSLEFLEKAKIHHDPFGDATAKFVARWAVAKLLRLNGRAREAEEIQKELEAEMAARKEPDGFVYEELGELSLAAGRGEAAREYFGKAYLLLKNVDWLVESEPGRVERVGKLGFV
jgi:tetratricopeptide (TPR) repeat protein